MRKSRSDTAETKERIVSTASAMFLDKGLEAVGMREIMGAANLTQGGFYRHFGSKEELVIEANRRAFDHLLTMLESETLGKSSQDAVERIVSLYLSQVREGSIYRCPLSMIGAELSHFDTEVRAVAVSGHRRLVQLLADHLPNRGKAEALGIASGIVSTMVGAVTLAHIAPDPVTAAAIVRNAEALIRSQLPPGKKRMTKKTASGGQRQKPST